MSEQQFDLIRGVEESAEGFAAGEAVDPVLGVAGGIEGFVDGATGKPINPVRDAQEAWNYINGGAPGEDYNDGGAPEDY